MDAIKELGALAFASRLRRLSEQLMRDVNQIYQNLQIDFEARWFTMLFVLNERSPMRVTDLAESMRVTHTAVNQLAAEMMAHGLVRSSRTKSDERQRLIGITVRGKAVAQQLNPVWQEIKAVTGALIAGTGCDVLRALAEIEKQLEETSLLERVGMRLEGRLAGEVVLRDYSPAAKKHFKSLNSEWLQEFFDIEPKDQRMLDDPRNSILQTGGAVLFACIGREYVGTGALIHHRGGHWEVAKMAVTRRYRGRGIGRLLLQTLIQRAKDAGAQSLYLRTCLSLKAANHLYRNFGFRKTKIHPFNETDYLRPTYVMKLEL